MKVVLKRGSEKGDVEWNDANPKRARSRAEALAELHDADLYETPEGFAVDAVMFYTGKPIA